jgi:hypothetical protein
MNSGPHEPVPGENGIVAAGFLIMAVLVLVGIIAAIGKLS